MLLAVQNRVQLVSMVEGMVPPAGLCPTLAARWIEINRVFFNTAPQLKRKRADEETQRVSKQNMAEEALGATKSEDQATDCQLDSLFDELQ